MIDRQVAQLTRLVDDLLDVSRIGRGKISLHRDVIDFANLVRLAAEDYRTTLEAAELTLTLFIPDHPVWVRGDAARLSQTLGNLLHNAAKFTSAGGGVTIRLATEPAAGGAILTIHDTGIGMESQVLAHVFEPFSQADHSLERSAGGLGLALVKGLVDLHGGTVSADSEGLGKGPRSPFSSSLKPSRRTVRPLRPPQNPRGNARGACW